MVQPQARRALRLAALALHLRAALTTQLNQALYQAFGAAGTGCSRPPLSPSTTPQIGLDVVKTFRFDSSYVVTRRSQVKRNGAPVRALVDGPPAWATWRSSCLRLSRAARLLTHLLLRTGPSTASRIHEAAAKVSGNAHHSSSTMSTRPSPTSTSPRPFCPTSPERATRGHAAQHHRPAQRPDQSQQPEEAGPRHRPRRGRHQRRHAPAPLRRPQAD